METREYRVVEIFDSVQGEGTWLGRPCTFIRLAGCNLGCSWCDTDYSKYQKINTREIIERVDQHFVVITGGEPLLQFIKPLIVELRNTDHAVGYETNGTLPMVYADWIVCSPKSLNGYLFDGTQAKPNELKYVVDSSFNSDIAIPEQVRRDYAYRIWLQPESSQMHLNWLKCHELAMSDYRLRVGVQLHKIMGVR